MDANITHYFFFAPHTLLVIMLLWYSDGGSMQIPITSHASITKVLHFFHAVVLTDSIGIPVLKLGFIGGIK